MSAAKGSACTPLGPIVATYVYDSSQGQHTHSARTKITPLIVDTQFRDSARKLLGPICSARGMGWNRQKENWVHLNLTFTTALLGAITSFVFNITDNFDQFLTILPLIIFILIPQNVSDFYFLTHLVLELLVFIYFEFLVINDLPTWILNNHFSTFSVSYFPVQYISLFKSRGLEQCNIKVIPASVKQLLLKYLSKYILVPKKQVQEIDYYDLHWARERDTPFCRTEQSECTMMRRAIQIGGLNTIALISN